VSGGHCGRAGGASPCRQEQDKTRQDKTGQDKTGQEEHSRKNQRRHKATGHAQQRHVALQSNPATSDETPTASNMLYLAIIQSMCLPATDMHGAPIRHRYRIIVGRLLDLYEQTRLFLSFPYVCPEPVLARRSFFSTNGAKRRVFLPASAKFPQPQSR
jgi:hypothetical protein